ncbi:MAG TPA: DUF881 domain-containing protein [Chloroflexota bacterium]|nr:DUF881 domain-containing protein [Chloroflexota bacterium]
MSAVHPEAHLPAAAPSVTPSRASRLGQALDWHRARALGHVRRGTIGLTIVAVILGVYLAAQWQSKPRRAVAAPEYRREVANATVQRLEAEQADLKRQIADLRVQLAQQQKSAASGGTHLADLTAQLESEKVLAGTVPLRGPGLRVLLDDSAVKTIPTSEDPGMYIVHEYQLRDVVNVLWAAGAEAISINGERMVGPSSIYCVGSTILINDVRTSPPYEFLVVGDQARLEAALADPVNLRALKGRVKVYGLQFSLQRAKALVVPAYTGSLDVRQVVLPSAELQATLRSFAK